MSYLRIAVSSTVRLRAAALALLLVVTAGAAACGGEPEPARTDVQIKEDVVARLEAASIPGLQVEVNAGVVTLTGSVYTQADADRVVSLVKSVEGVTDVQNGLTAGGAPPETGPAAVPPQLGEVSTPDQVTAAKLIQTYKASPVLAGSSITPTVVGGVATLAGTVPTDQAKAEAERITKATAGIASVNNQLQVVAAQVVTVPDNQIETAVRELIDTSYPDIIVTPTVAQGTVKLRGAADSRKQVLEITDRIYRIKGVKAVDTSLLTVTGGEEGDRIGAPATKQ